MGFPKQRRWSMEFILSLEDEVHNAPPATKKDEVDHSQLKHIEELNLTMFAPREEDEEEEPKQARRYSEAPPARRRNSQAAKFSRRNSQQAELPRSNSKIDHSTVEYLMFVNQTNSQVSTNQEDQRCNYKRSRSNRNSLTNLYDRNACSNGMSHQHQTNNHHQTQQRQMTRRHSQGQCESEAVPNQDFFDISLSSHSTEQQQQRRVPRKQQPSKHQQQQLLSHKHQQALLCHQTRKNLKRTRSNRYSLTSHLERGFKGVFASLDQESYSSKQKRSQSHLDRRASM